MEPGLVPTSTFSAPLGDVATVGDPLACSPVPAESLAGLFALVQQGAPAISP